MLFLHADKHRYRYIIDTFDCALFKLYFNDNLDTYKGMAMGGCWKGCIDDICGSFQTEVYIIGAELGWTYGHHTYNTHANTKQVKPLHLAGC